MFKNIILTLIIMFLPINKVFADIKYTQITSSNIDYSHVNAPSEIIQGMQANSNKTETFYIKKNKMRVDTQKYKTSRISRCDKKHTIILEHDIKKYVLSPLKIDNSCKNQKKKKSEKDKKSYKGEIKTVITDTKKNESIGQFKTRKYIIKYSTTENSSLSPFINKTEEIWIANIKDEIPQCLTNNCQGHGANDVKVIRKGPDISRGLIVKKSIIVQDPTDVKKKNITTTIIKDLSRKPLPDSLFEIPKGYTLLSE